MVRQEADGWWLELHETIASHHDDVFECLTTASGLSRWFPVAATMDLRQGGEVVFGWDADMDKRSTVAILDYDPAGRLTWDWYASVDDTHAPVYWSIAPAVEEGTRVELRQGPFADSVEGMIALAEEAETWRWYLCNLRSVLEARHDMRRTRPL